MTKDEALKLALEALERVNSVDDDCDILSPSLADAVGEAIDVVKEALAQPEPTNIERHEANVQKFLGAPQPEQEPVALPCCGYADASAIKWNPHNQVVQCHNCGQIYTAPPQRTWVALTDEERKNIMIECESTGDWAWELKAAQAIEAKLKEKNNG